MTCMDNFEYDLPEGYSWPSDLVVFFEGEGFRVWSFDEVSGALQEFRRRGWPPHASYALIRRFTGPIECEKVVHWTREDGEWVTQPVGES